MHAVCQAIFRKFHDKICWQSSNSPMVYYNFTLNLLQFCLEFTTNLTLSPDYVMEKEEDYSEGKFGEEDLPEITECDEANGAM